MDFKEALTKLEESEDYKKWRASNPEHFLTHGFTTTDAKLEAGIWEAGYYNSSTEKITTFVIDETITQKPEDEVLKKETDKVKTLDMEKVVLTFEQAKDAMLEFLKNKHPSENPNKAIVLLQHLEQSIVWNITIITHTFHAINAKLDASTGEVLYDDKISFFDLGRVDE